MTRNSFLKIFTLAPGAVAASHALTAKAGGEVNVRNSPSAYDVDRMREVIDADIIKGRLPDCLETRDNALYDLMHVPAGRETFERWLFFAYPIGQPRAGYPSTPWGEGNVKTLRDTNMYRGCQLPPPEAFYVERLFFLFDPEMDERDRNALCASQVFELTIGRKVVARAPLSRCPITGHLRDLVTYADNGFPSSMCARNKTRIDVLYNIAFKKPVYIGSLEQFGLTLFGKPFTVAKDVNLFAFLDGVHVL